MRTEQEALDDWKKDNELKYGNSEGVRTYPKCTCHLVPPTQCLFHGSEYNGHD